LLTNEALVDKKGSKTTSSFMMKGRRDKEKGWERGERIFKSIFQSPTSISMKSQNVSKMFSENIY
jgi:hypothetical protein